MTLKDLEPFRAELVALGSGAAAMVGMLTDHEMLAVISSAPGLFAMYGRYIKGTVTAQKVAEAVAEEMKKK